MKLIAPSILAADFTKLADEIRKVEEAKADLLHLDIMDGHFVPNITFGPFITEFIVKGTSLPVDAHLMVESPEMWLEPFAEVGAHQITVHYEATPHVHRCVQKIRGLGKKAGIAINPSTPVSVLEDILPFVDVVLIMTVNPGFGGQKFIPECLPKISKLHEMIAKQNFPTQIAVDGGISLENIKKVSQAGAHIFIAGSSIFKTENYIKTIQEMRKALT